MTKGHVTLIICGIITALALVFPGDWRSFIYTVGVTAFVGCATNALAIKMLFDYIYIDPWHKWGKLPYSGILEDQRAEVAGAIGWTVAQKLLTTEVILKTVGSDEFQKMAGQIINTEIREILNEPGFFETMIGKMERDMHAFLDGEIFRSKLQHVVFSRMGAVGSILVEFKNVRDKDKVTPMLQKGMKDVVTHVCASEEFHDAFRDFCKKLPSKFALHQSQLKEDLQDHTLSLFRELVEKADLERVVAAQVSTFAPGELSSLIIKITAENLDWLEVWGGVLGGLCGAIFWIVERWCVPS